MYIIAVYFSDESVRRNSTHCTLARGLCGGTNESESELRLHGCALHTSSVSDPLIL